MTRPRTMCASCTQPVANPPSSPAVHGPEDWLCVACAADERRLMRVAGEAGHCPDCDPGSFDEVGRACVRHDLREVDHVEALIKLRGVYDGMVRRARRGRL